MSEPELKYKTLIHQFEPETPPSGADGEVTGGNPQLCFRGAAQIPGAGFNLGFRVISAPVLAEPYPHKHGEDEFLMFSSSTLNSKDWNAHLELTIGIGDDAEIYSIDEPTTVRIPAGVWHGPLNFVRVDSPVFFQPALLRENFGGTYMLPDGKRELYF
ncbi:MAG: hypothetical protein LBN99_05530 [Oscillospiraceae bacterium]|nr:hypothetical protein [Oscillospiraceae bacterium]